MRFNPEKQRRRSIRLKGYDYAQAGAYFVTICTYDRTLLFGDVLHAEMRLNACGKIAQECWAEAPHHFENVNLDAFVIMPNHLHGIVIVVGQGRGTACRAPTKERFGRPMKNSLPTMVRSFKSAVTHRINEMRGAPGLPVRQRGYYERILREEHELETIREYIFLNPAKWEEDQENPFRKKE